jgi:hypothetical protein
MVCLIILAARPSVRGRGNAALILRLQILRHLRDRQIQGDVVEPRHRSARQREAGWDQICFYVPRKVVRLRKLGLAGLLTVWAHKIFSPVLTHRRNMRPESGIFQPGSSPRIVVVLLAPCVIGYIWTLQ